MFDCGVWDIAAGCGALQVARECTLASTVVHYGSGYCAVMGIDINTHFSQLHK